MLFLLNERESNGRKESWIYFLEMGKWSPDKSKDWSQVMFMIHGKEPKFLLIKFVLKNANSTFRTHKSHLNWEEIKLNPN